MRKIKESHYNYIIYPVLGLLVRIIFLHLAWYIYNSDIQRSYHAFVYFSSFSIHENFWITYASWMDSGLVPYIDFYYDYPPLGALIIFLPTLFASIHYYPLAFGYIVSIVDMFNIMLICNLSTHFMVPKYRKILIWSYIAFPPIIFFSIVRLDAFVTLFILLAFQSFFIRNNSIQTFFFIGLGILVKILPVFLVPPFLIILYKQRRYNEILKTTAVLLMTIFFGFLPFLLQEGGFEGIMWMIQFHLGRRIDDGAIFFMIFGIPSKIIYGNGYVIPEKLKVFQIIIQVTVYLIVLWRLLKEQNNDTDIEYVFDAYFWVIMLNTVVNPQFLLTIIAMTCISGKGKKVLASLSILTFYWGLLYFAYLIGYSNFAGPANVPTR